MLFFADNMDHFSFQMLYQDPFRVENVNWVTSPPKARVHVDLVRLEHTPRNIKTILLPMLSDK